MSEFNRLDQWKRDFPLRPGPLTDEEVKQAMRCRDYWILQHPLHSAISDWTREEQEYFAAVGRLIETTCEPRTNEFTVMTWVSTKKRLPEFEKEVLIYVWSKKFMLGQLTHYYNRGSCETETYWQVEHSSYGGNLQILPLADVTHWAELSRPD